MPNQTKHTRDMHEALREIGDTAFEIKRKRQSSHLDGQAMRDLQASLRMARSYVRKAYELTRAVDLDTRRADDERRIDAAIMGTISDQR